MTSRGDTRRYFMPRWYVRVACALALVQVVGGIALAWFGEPRLGLLFVVGGLFVGFQGHLTARTPVALVDDEGIELRAAPLAPPRRLRFSEIRGVATVDGLFLQFDLGTDRDPRIPLTALSEADVRELLETLRHRIE